MSKRAAGVLIVEDGKVLSVSRGKDLNNWGIVTGKVEPNETWEEAATRECFEETGLRVYGLTEIFSALDGEFLVKTFSVDKYFGEIVNSKEGIVAWKTPEELMTHSPFAEYNKQLFQHLGWIK